MVQTQRRKLLAVLVALSLTASNATVNEKAEPVCMPDRASNGIEGQVDTDKGKVRK